MVLTAAQMAAFFEHDNQMGIPHKTVAQMAIEGITTVSDLAKFDKDSLEQLVNNLCQPGGRVADPNPNAVPGAMIPTLTPKETTVGCPQPGEVLCCYQPGSHCRKSSVGYCHEEF